MRYLEGESLPCPGVLEIAGLEAADRSSSPEAHDDLVSEGHVYDARTGEELDLALVGAGRLKELGQMLKHNVYKEVPPSEAKGWKVKSRWVDEIRVKNGVREVHSRLVAMEFNTYGREDANRSCL